MWISKEGDVRKQELISAAFDLFCEKGYEHTSINDIIGKVGVTKGAFYYYFNSKEDILHILVDAQVNEIVEITGQIADKQDLIAIEKIEKLIKETHEFRINQRNDRLKLYKLLENESNSRLTRKITEQVIQYGQPEMLKILKQGVTEGLFEVRFMDETAEFMIELSIILNSYIQKALLKNDEDGYKKEDVIEKLAFYEDVVIKILGIKKRMDGFLQKIFDCYF